MMAVTAGAIGYPEGAWGAAHDLHHLVLILGAAAIVMLCLLGGLVWMFVAWALRDRPKQAGTKTKIVETQERRQDTKGEPSDPWGPKPR
jgi:hypothetical protein